MAENSKIEWTTHTFNPVIGCQKVSPGCDHCYAEALMDKRYHKVEWGPHGERKRTSEANWKLPLRWAKAARATGERPRVFCASLADVFDNKWNPQDRSDLFALIRATPELDWLLLTKRPENIGKMLPQDWHRGYSNVWLGTTAEDQANYNRRWPILSHIPAALAFISYEPAIGKLIDLYATAGQAPDWIICGGESGHGAREMHPDWARDLRDECAERSIPFFMKQLGSKSHLPGVTGKGDDPSQWPHDLRIREFPNVRR
jgi:protein gp37